MAISHRRIICRNLRALLRLWRRSKTLTSCLALNTPPCLVLRLATKGMSRLAGRSEDGRGRARVSQWRRYPVRAGGDEERGARNKDGHMV